MTEQLPLVSIVTPSFNQGRWLEESIRSVLDQDYPNIEYLVMDGGSTDGSLDVLRRYEGRVRYNSGPDGGQSQALCTAYARMKGEILGWINADDAYTPGAVRRAVQALTAEPKLGMVYGNAEFIDGAGRPLGVSRHVAPVDDSDPLLRLGDCVVQPAAFFRRNAYEAVGGLDPALHYTMDYELWLKICPEVPQSLPAGEPGPRPDHAQHQDRQRRLEAHGGAGGGGAQARRQRAAGLVRHRGLGHAPARCRPALASGGWRRPRRRPRRRSSGLASGNTVAALALPRTWRMVRQRLRNAA